MLRAEAEPGDVVVYCPDQLGPAVHRLAPQDLDEFTYPTFGSPEFVDWVDYKAGSAQADPQAFARQVLERSRARTRSGTSSSPGYITHPVVCETLSTLFAQSRDRAGARSRPTNGSSSTRGSRSSRRR